MSNLLREKPHGPLGRETPMNSDTVQTGNPFKKKAHSYDEVNLFKATHVKRYMSKQDVMTYEFTNGTSFDLKVTQKFDRNVYMKLPDEIVNAPLQTRVECAINLFWTWKKATGQMTSDMPKVTDLIPREEIKPGPIAQMLLDERAANHPDLFDASGNARSDEPLVNPKPMSDDELATRLERARQLEAQMKQDAAAVDAERAEFAATFPTTAQRKEQETIVTDKPSANDWITDEGKRKRFWGAINDLRDAYDLTEEQRDEIIAELAGGKLHDYAGTAAAIIKAFKEAGEKWQSENSPKEADISQPIPNDSADEKRREIPPQITVKNGIQSNGGKVSTNIIKLDEAQIRAKYTKKLQGGKEYLEVAGRVLLFRLDHPAESGWTIDTELVHADDKGCIFKAKVANADGHIIATGHARALEAKSGNFSGRIFEKAETAAIGRALAHAGYGTDDVEEADDSDSPAHLADSPRKAS